VNTCSICYQVQTPTVDAMLYAGVPIAEVARRTGLSRQAIGRHKRAGHPILRGHGATAKPATSDQVYVYSGDEVAMNDWVDERFPAALAAVTGIEAETVGRCWSSGDDPAHSCPSCEVPAAVYDPVFASLEAAYRLDHQVAPGSFEPRQA
jgi:hypothetical protein